MEANVVADSWWLRAEGRSILRGYLTVQQMLDDIWLAQEHGWLPVSMTEERRKIRWTTPSTWLRKEITYVVAYRHGQR
jgi:hypothetical protein